MDGDEWCDALPLGVVLVVKGTFGHRVLFIHPYAKPKRETDLDSTEQTITNTTPITNKSRNDSRGTLGTSTAGVDEAMVRADRPTSFGGLTTEILSSILSASSSDTVFEIKIDNVRFAGYKQSLENGVENIGDAVSHFSIVFVLRAPCETHIVDGFQQLSRKLALAINGLQKIKSFFHKQERLMQEKLDDLDAKIESEQMSNPYEEVAEHSKLAELLAKVYDDVKRTGSVRVFVDDFVEVGFCVEPLALRYQHLTPKSRHDIDRLIKRIRPYHGILLLEDVSPSPDANPSVTLLIKFCSADKSIQAMSLDSGIPLQQVFLIVRHLLLWARAIVIYPLCNTNVYSCLTEKRPLGQQMERFSRQFSGSFHMATALAHFNPPASLNSFVDVRLHQDEQQMRAKVVVSLLRHQLLMQLHQFCYLMPPFSDESLPEPKINDQIDFIQNIYEPGSSIPDEIRPFVERICRVMLEEDAISTVSSRLEVLMQMAEYLHGENHVEDIMYRLGKSRREVMDVLDSFSSVIARFLRPDWIAE